VSGVRQVRSIEDVQSVTEAVLDRVEEAVVGKRAVLATVLAAFLADGHVLVDDVPGVAKTLLARSFAQVMGLDFGRIQFTPDLLPADVTGGAVLGSDGHSLEFRPGPIFTQLLLADEINRTSPKTQSALLEAMAERQVTAEGRTRRLPSPFLVIATQNPIEHEGTYPLPEAQLDRFLVRTSVGYPAPDDEWEMVRRRLERRTEEVHLSPVLDAEGLLALQRAVETVHCSEAVGRYAIEIVEATRRAGELRLGASPRGTLALVRTARARAAMAGRDFVLPDDVKALTTPVLAHRLVLTTELWVRQVPVEEVLASVVASVPVPVAPSADR